MSSDLITKEYLLLFSYVGMSPSLNADRMYIHHMYVYHINLCVLSLPRFMVMSSVCDHVFISIQMMFLQDTFIFETHKQIKYR